MGYELPALPYEPNALEPHISSETLNYHYEKRHRGYAAKLNAALKETELATAPLETIIRSSSGRLFDNATQVWNHCFYWDSMSPSGGGEPGKVLTARLIADFGCVNNFKQHFSEAAPGRSGSGWAWWVQCTDGSLAITTTGNADTPPVGADTPLLTCDGWEHAYYIDRRNDRAAYVDAGWDVVNWGFAQVNASSN